MHERIAQLAEEATYNMDFVKNDDVLQTSTGEITYEIPAEFIKTFAELIVRECANIAFDEYAVTDGADSGEYAILKHFGVEE
jgi:hypothetical protein